METPSDKARLVVTLCLAINPERMDFLDFAFTHFRAHVDKYMNIPLGQAIDRLIMEVGPEAVLEALWKDRPEGTPRVIQSYIARGVPGTDLLLR